LLKTKFDNLVVYQDHAYGLSDGILECVEIMSGQRKWKKGRFGHGQIVGVNEFILVLSEGGDLSLVRASASGFEELAVLEHALEGKTWNNLCLYGRFLLVRNAEEAACYELPLAQAASP
jgi:outer membrane protein assembly factor BamB